MRDILKGLVILGIILVVCYQAAYFPFDNQSYIERLRKATHEMCTCGKNVACRDDAETKYLRYLDRLESRDSTEKQSKKIERIKNLYKYCLKHSRKPGRHYRGPPIQ